MGITTTQQLGLIKPDRQEATENWPFQNLINSMVIDNKAKAQFLTWTPTLTAATTNPVLGTGGEIEGKYIRLANRQIIAYGRFRFGTSGTSAGSGTYFVDLPVPADSNVHNILSNSAFDVIGRWVLRDDGITANTHVGTVLLDNDNEKVQFNSVLPVADDYPFASFGDTRDAVSFYCMYQEAAQ